MSNSTNYIRLETTFKNIPELLTWINKSKLIPIYYNYEDDLGEGLTEINKILEKDDLRITLDEDTYYINILSNVNELQHNLINNIIDKYKSKWKSFIIKNIDVVC